MIDQYAVFFRYLIIRLERSAEKHEKRQSCGTGWHTSWCIEGPRRERTRFSAGSDWENILYGEDGRDMEGRCVDTVVQRERGHPWLQEPQRNKIDTSHYEFLGANNWKETESRNGNSGGIDRLHPREKNLM